MYYLLLAFEEFLKIIFITIIHILSILFFPSVLLFKDPIGGFCNSGRSFVGRCPEKWNRIEIRRAVNL